MTERNTPRPTDYRVADAVPEADLAEQSVPAYPDDAPYSDIDSRVYPEDFPTPDETAPIPEPRDDWDADPADVAEQSIPVSLVDDYDGAYADEEP